MLGILRDDTKPEAQRFEAAKHAAPFVHPKLSAMSADLNVKRNIEDVLDELGAGDTEAAEG